MTNYEVVAGHDDRVRDHASGLVLSFRCACCSNPCVCGSAAGAGAAPGEGEPPEYVHTREKEEASFAYNALLNSVREAEVRLEETRRFARAFKEAAVAVSDAAEAEVAALRAAGPAPEPSELAIEAARATQGWVSYSDAATAKAFEKHQRESMREALAAAYAVDFPAVPPRAAPAGAGTPSDTTEARALAKAFWFALHPRNVQSEAGWRANGGEWTEAMIDAVISVRSAGASPGAARREQQFDAAGDDPAWQAVASRPAGEPESRNGHGTQDLADPEYLRAACEEYVIVAKDWALGNIRELFRQVRAARGRPPAGEPEREPNYGHPENDCPDDPVRALSQVVVAGKNLWHGDMGHLSQSAAIAVRFIIDRTREVQKRLSRGAPPSPEGDPTS